MESIAGIIDHTLLRPDATPVDVEQVCAEAREHGFITVCVNPCHVPQAARLLRGTRVGVTTVVGFPLGASHTKSKESAVHTAIVEGAAELDMVMNLGWFKNRDYQFVREDIEAVVEAAHGRVVKVIIETCLLDQKEKERATRLVVDAGAAFVKTSTGFCPVALLAPGKSGGATVEDVALLARVAAGRIGVKASGGIRDYETARQMVTAGATRLGTSASVAIIEQERLARKEE